MAGRAAGHCHAWAERLDRPIFLLQLPSVNLCKLSSCRGSLSCSIALHLQALLPVALQLSSLYQPPLLLLPTQVLRPARHPWAHLMAALVVAGLQLGKLA